MAGAGQFAGLTVPPPRSRATCLRWKPGHGDELAEKTAPLGECHNQFVPCRVPAGL
jgi:hypothetical protein